MTDADAPVPLKWLVATSLLQGFTLWALYLAMESDTWLASSPAWSVPLYTLALAVPLCVLLAVRRDNWRRLLVTLCGLALLLAVCGAFTGWSFAPEPNRSSSIVLIFVIAMVVGVFKFLMYATQYANGQTVSYANLFTYSWRHFLTVALSGAFTVGVALVLFLWAKLFEVVGIDVFGELFSKTWFLVPTLSVAFGVGVAVFRNLERILDSITRLLEGLIRLLLPLAAFVAILFAATLPFVGLQPLWDTGNGTALLLWLVALVLFFANAVYQTGEEPLVYPMWVRWLVCIALLTLPVYAALAVYGLALRVAEYGWTVERCWGMAVTLLLSAFAVGYAFGVVRHRLDWPRMLARTNIHLGWVVFAVVVLASSPLLDFRAISLASQVQRVDEGTINWHEFDFYYAEHHLGRVGHALAADLRQEYAHDEKLVALIDTPLRPWQRDRAGTQAQMFDRAKFLGEPFPIPEAFRESDAIRYHDNSVVPVLGQINLDDDAEPEIVVLLTYDNRYSHGFIADREPATGQWTIHNLAGNGHCLNDMQLESLELTLTPPQFQSITIGDITFRVLPNSDGRCPPAINQGGEEQSPG